MSNVPGISNRYRQTLFTNGIQNEEDFSEMAKTYLRAIVGISCLSHPNYLINRYVEKQQVAYMLSLGRQSKIFSPAPVNSPS